MREGWKTAAIEDIAQVVNGGTPKTNVPEYWDGRHLWITPAEMGRLDSPYIAISRRKLTDAGLQNSSASLVPKNSVILSTRAPIGHLVINDEPMAFNQGCRGLVPRQQVHYKYLYYFLFSSVDLLNELGSGTTFKELAAGKLKKVELPVPPFPEQKRIVAILDEAFAGIATAVANTQKNLANARELFESYLHVLFDRICRERGTVRLGDVCKTGSGGTPRKSERRFYEDGKIPWLLSGEVSKKEITKSSKFITDYGLKNSAAKIFPENTVLVAMYGATAGQAGILRFASATNQAVCGVYPNDRFLPEFLYYNFLYRNKELVATASGNAQPNISQIKVKNVLVPNLLRSDQVAASAALESLNEEIEGLAENYQRKLQSLNELKQSLLQKAFSGELTAAPHDEIETALA